MQDHFFTLSYLSAEQKRQRCQKMLDAVREHFRIVTTADFLKDPAAGKNHYGCQTGS